MLYNLLINSHVETIWTFKSVQNTQYTKINYHSLPIEVAQRRKSVFAYYKVAIRGCLHNKHLKTSLEVPLRTYLRLRLDYLNQRRHYRPRC